MGDKSKIEWTDATWNPIVTFNRQTGRRGWFCTHVSDGCRFCYAEHINGVRDTGLGYAAQGLKEIEIRLLPEVLEQPLRWKRPRKIFVSSMGDLFHEAVGDDFLDSVFASVALAQRHIFQILTKRPQRMMGYLGENCSGSARHGAVNRAIERLAEEKRTSEQEVWNVRRRCAAWAPQCPWPLPNAWLGVSVENQQTADERIPPLLRTPAAIRFVNYEPALGPVDLHRYLFDAACPVCSTWSSTARAWLGRPCPACGHEPYPAVRLDWVIAGGESGPQARPPHPDWFRIVRDQCRQDGVPYFFKAWGEWAPHGPIADGDRLHFSSARPRNRMIDGALMDRRGKRGAGRLLDGREWNEFPAAC